MTARRAKSVTGRSGIFWLIAITACGFLWAAAAAHAQQLAGVVVDADGVVRKQVYEDPTGQVHRQRIAAAQAALNPEVSARSKLRKISLQRLERAIERQLADGREPTEEMRHLAGLTRVRYVFFYPDSRDIVIAGPAEGWMTDMTGRVRGIHTGDATVELEDLIVALRAHAPGKQAAVIGCSIDPTQEGLARMQEFLRQLGGRATPNDTQFIVEGLRTSLGMQKVSILGVAPNTHFAQVLVEADYRMKLIGIGLEQPPVRLVSYVAKAKPRDVGRNALQRWYFTPDYQCVRVSEDQLGMELVGDGVQLVGADELVTADGARRRSSSVDRASQVFVNSFTTKYPELAKKSPVYAQLRNLIDLAVAAAFIQQQDYYGQADWRMEILGDEEKVPVETYNTPVEVETAVTSIWKGNQLMTPVGGGVDIQAHLALQTDKLLPDDRGDVARQRGDATPQLAAERWWWD